MRARGASPGHPNLQGRAADVAALSLLPALDRRTQRSSDLPYREISRDSGREIPACALFDVSVGKQIINGRRVMMLKLDRIAVVFTAALTLAAAAIPTKAEAADLAIPRAPVIPPRPVAYAPPPPPPCCQVYVPPPPPCCQVAPPPCCQVYAPPPPPPCCVYGGGYGGG